MTMPIMMPFFFFGLLLGVAVSACCIGRAAGSGAVSGAGAAAGAGVGAGAAAGVGLRGFGVSPPFLSIITPYVFNLMFIISQIIMLQYAYG